MSTRAGTAPGLLLLVEDNEADAGLVRTVALDRPRPPVIRVAPTARHALDEAMAAEAANERFDLVLLDLNLPDRPGLDLLIDLRDHPSLAGTSIVILSSSTVNSDREQAARAGASGYLVKHVNWARFRADLHETLERYLPSSDASEVPERQVLPPHPASQLPAVPVHSENEGNRGMSPAPDNPGPLPVSGLRERSGGDPRAPTCPIRR